MAIVSAQVESSGWVLRLVVSGAAGGFGNYALDPDGAARVVLATGHAGFVQSGGTAVPGVMARSLVGMVPLRLPVNLASPLVEVIDETDAGGGNRAVRIALSQNVYATDTGLTLSVLAGWRTGESAASGIAVSNGSTLAAPLPIMRWAVAPFQMDAGGVFRLSLFVASHHPVGFEPVAGVKFTLTDGTNVKTAWATALGTDNSAGDTLRCYTLTIDAGAATALGAGLLRADAEVYPWLGAMRSTDVAGTRPMVNLRDVVRNTGAANPLVLAHDPAGTRYGSQWVMLDPVAGSETASAAMVGASLALARAVPTKARTVNTAIQALYLQNRSLAAANGGSAGAGRVADGARIVLPAGVSVVGTTSVTTGMTYVEAPLRIIGDPDDVNPRANCILRTGTVANGNSRTLNYLIQNLTMEVGQQTALSGSTGINAILDNIELRGKAGFQASAANIIGVAPPTNKWSFMAFRVKWWRTNALMNSGANRFAIIRASEHPRCARACIVVKNRFIPEAEDGTFTSTGTIDAFGGWDVAANTEGCEDNIIAFNDARGLKARFMQVTAATTLAETGTAIPSIRRLAVINNLAEQFSVGTGGQPFFVIGENQNHDTSYCIVEGNSFAGQRCNFFYNEPPVATLAETETKTNPTRACRVANNAFDWNPNKHDAFNDPDTIALRGGGTATGYRPHLVHGWSDHMGVGREGNFDALHADASPSFNLYFYGLRSRQGTAPGALSLGVVDNRSNTGTNTGLGDYRPLPSSLLLGRVRNGNSDRDFAGAARMMNGAAGAFEAAGGAAALDVVPGGALHDHRAAAAALSGSLAVAPAGAALMVTGGATTLMWRADLTPEAGVLPMLGGAAGLDFGAVTIAAADSVLTLTCGTVGLITPGVSDAARRLRVMADVRVHFVRMD